MNVTNSMNKRAHFCTLKKKMHKKRPKQSMSYGHQMDKKYPVVTSKMLKKSSVFVSSPAEVIEMFKQLTMSRECSDVKNLFTDTKHVTG